MKYTVIFLGLALWSGLTLVPAASQSETAVADPLLAGAALYDRACVACHADGLNNAPRVGDRARWSRLVKEGPAKVTAHGWLGERAMPPRGGVPDLQLADFAAAVAVMAQRSQTRWPAIDAAHLQAVEREVKKETDLRARRTGAKPAAR